MNLKTFISKKRILSNIERFGMESVIKKQNLCDHGYSVGSLCYLICQTLDIEITAEELFKVMNHDFVEAYTGDLNKSIKMQIPNYKEIEKSLVPEDLQPFTDEGLKRSLSPDVYSAFLIADMWDAYLYIYDEIALGNTNLESAKTHYWESIFKHPLRRALEDKQLKLYKGRRYR